MKTKLHFQRIFATLLLLAVSVLSWAWGEERLEVDGIYYIYTNYGFNATVTYKDINYNSYSGNVVIPSSVIGANVNRIGDRAFYNSSDLTSVTIPKSVTSIGNYAFSDCPKLKSVTYASLENNVTSIGDYAFADCSSLTSVFISGYTTSIGEYAFAGTGLKYVDIPFSVTSISTGLFAYCFELKSVTLPEDVTSIGDEAFFNCNSLTSINIPNSVTIIGNSAFHNCYSLTSVNIPNGVTSISPCAFFNCCSLTSVNIPNSVTSIGNGGFSGCSGLTSITVPESVKSIGENAFRGCSGLTFITIPKSVTSIGNSVFSECYGLTSVTLPKGVSSIGDYTFYDCINLTSVTIPNSVTSIGDKAFYNCNNLKSVTCLAEEVPITDLWAFEDVPLSSATLYVPESSVDAYKEEYPWCEFGTILPIDGDGGDDHIYIETDLTSEFPVDWQGWTGATGYTSTQFAPRVTTNDGRNVQVCEKFNGGSATLGTVFTRTLSGLTNGTYRIELYGAAASTKGRDTGIDSDMTEEDEGDETAVYLYAKTASGTVKQYIPVLWATSFSEIATAVLNGVTVTDGTVELGMVSEKKFTNWEVIQIKGVTALVDATELHANTLSKAKETIKNTTYVNVTGSERTALSRAIRKNTKVSEQTAEAYQDAISDLEMAMKAFTDAKASYDAWTDIKGRNFPYASVAKKAAAESAAAVSPTSAADAVSRRETLLPLYRQYAESSAMLEGVNGATDMTSYINNPKAEEGVDGWTTVRDEGSGGSINILVGQPWTDGSGDTNHKYFDGGNWGASAWDVAFQQDITLPAGKYQLTAIGRSERDVALTLFAGDETAEMAHISSIGGLFNNGWEQTSLEFELTGNTTVSIGVRGVTSLIHNWMSFSNFRLVQFPEGYDAINSLTAEKTIVDANAPIYDLNGRRLIEKPKSGYYIQGGKKYYVEK
ncbi:MAG: leucine-rich repeat protein [Bacteroidaceae bacterium]|nr:leucine-rich repeat protein [Bacteroidaceae bacterium]